MLKTRKVKCLSCKECIDLEYYVETGDMIKCSHCYCEFELIKLFPPRLQRLYARDDEDIEDLPYYEDDEDLDDEEDDDFDYFH